MDCKSLTSVDLSSFNTQNVTSMTNMFFNCASLTSLDLSNFSGEELHDMTNIFKNCIKLSYIVFPSVPETLYFDRLAFQNISKTGEIKVDKNIVTKIEEIFNSLELNWTITEK